MDSRLAENHFRRVHALHQFIFLFTFAAGFKMIIVDNFQDLSIKLYVVDIK